MSEDRGIDEPGLKPLYLRVLLVDDHIRIEVTAEGTSFDEGMKSIQGLCEQWLIDRNRYADIAKIAKLGPIKVAHQVSVTKDQIDVARGIAAESYRDSVWPHGGDAMQRWAGGESDTRYAKTA